MGLMWLEREEGIFLMPIPDDPIAAFQDKGARVSTGDLLAARHHDRSQETK
jgi:hypothetical protein